MPAWAAIPAVLAAGTACGLASGGLVARFRIQPFIATLAMMVFARGLAKMVSGGQKVSTAVQQADGAYKYVEVPAVFHAVNSRILGDNLAVVTLMFFACVVVSWVLLARLRWGRYIYAVGGNEEAARLSGVPVPAHDAVAYGTGGPALRPSPASARRRRSSRAIRRPAWPTSWTRSPWW